MNNPYEEMDKKDDVQILSQMFGYVVSDAASKLYYKDGNIESISKRGLDLCISNYVRRNNVALEENEVKFEPDPTEQDSYLFTARVTEYKIINGQRVFSQSVIGTKCQSVFENRKGNLVKDKFWFEKGSQKAYRNAKMKIVPYDEQVKVIALAKYAEKKNMSSCQAIAQNQNHKELAPPQTPQLTEEQKRQENIKWYNENYKIWSVKEFPITGVKIKINGEILYRFFWDDLFLAEELICKNGSPAKSVASYLRTMQRSKLKGYTGVNKGIDIMCGIVADRMKILGEGATKETAVEPRPEDEKNVEEKPALDTEEKSNETAMENSPTKESETEIPNLFEEENQLQHNDPS